MAEGISINETYLSLVDVATGKTTLLTPKGGKDTVAYSNAAFAKDGKGLYVTLDRDSEFQRLAYMDLASKKVDFLTPDTADVDEFDISPDGKTIAYVANEKGVSVLHLFDTVARAGAAGAQAAAGHDRQRQVAQGRRHHRVHAGDGARQLRRVLLRRRRPERSTGGPSARRAGSTRPPSRSPS